jgi:hypothetical protein
VEFDDKREENQKSKKIGEDFGFAPIVTGVTSL